MSLARQLALALASLIVVSPAPLFAQGVVITSGSIGFGKSHGGKSLAVTFGTVSPSPYSFRYALSPYCGPAASLVVTGPPLVLLPRRNLLDDITADLALRRLTEPRPDRFEDRFDPLPGQFAGGFVPLDDANRARARQIPKPVPPPAEALPKPIPIEPKAGPKPAEQKPLPPRVRKQELPTTPADTPLLERGKEVFAAGEYGRAAELFARAVAARPDDANARFAQIEALVALGKYHAAHVALLAALERVPEWPMLALKPIDLYGPNPAAYSEHLRSLEEARLAYPDDAVLLFLSAHVLWFDGRKDEARLLFDRVLTTIPEAIRYLRTLPGSAL